MTGTAVQHSNLYRSFAGVLAAAEVPRRNFHSLRHLHASALILDGVTPRAVSHRLGHTDVAFTLKTYVHLFETQQREAVLDMTSILG